MLFGKRNSFSSLGKLIFIFCRFNFVGIISTAIYFATGFLLLKKTAFDPLFVFFYSFLFATLFSYIGHSRITFRYSSKAIFFRFLFSTLFLFSFFSIANVFVSHFFPDSGYIGILLTGIFYPISSFLVHNVWTFRR